MYWDGDEICAGYETPSNTSDCILYRTMPPCAIVTSFEVEEPRIVMADLTRFSVETGKIAL